MGNLPRASEVAHQACQGLVGLGIGSGGQVRREGGRGRGAVSSIVLDEAQLATRLQQMGGITVA